MDPGVNQSKLMQSKIKEGVKKGDSAYDEQSDDVEIDL